MQKTFVVVILLITALSAGQNVVAEEKAETLGNPSEKKPSRQLVHFAPASEIAVEIERSKDNDGNDVTTVIGRLYVWQKLADADRMLELLADNAVVFSTGETKSDQSLPGGDVRAIYLSGDVVMTEGPRSIRADELYYNFADRTALVINAEMRTFDALRGIPIYLRAAKLRQVSENKFSADDITLTSSEFYKPQISMVASKVIVADTTVLDGKQNTDSSLDVQMSDTGLKLGETTVFSWPFIRSNLLRPDMPLESAHMGHDSTWGYSLETRWYLSRLLGLKEPEGTQSSLNLDHMSKRGVGSGLDIDYTRDNSFGRITGYIINDRGEDKLGRMDSRRNLEPERELRGRFEIQHRQFLPFNWQLSTEVGYSSDKNFIESYYRDELNADKKKETLLHMKRIEENWSLSVLGKMRINEHDDELEELPGLEYHLTGESVFDDKFTLYSDSRFSRGRQRIGYGHGISINEEFYNFVSHRGELDLPFSLGNIRVVPFTAGTYGYDDRSGFRRSLVDGSDTGDSGEENVWLGEAGLRVSSQYWKVYPSFKSRLWDLHQLRHVMRPHLTAVAYTENESVIKQRDILNFGLSQKWQTKRLRRGRQSGQRQYETVDWMRLNFDLTFVDDPESSQAGPDRMIWNRPFVPLSIMSAPDIFNADMGGEFTRFELYGPRRNYFSADYSWRLSDTSAVSADCYYDMLGGTVEQFNVGISRYRWPNLTYYIGSRYLRNVEVLDEKGSNAITFAATYELDPRYTLVFSQQYDFDYGHNSRSDVALIRRYHRIYCGISFSADHSLDRQAIIFSIWPQGVSELGIGPERYMGLGR